ncbi:short-chain dehydrogenase reductase family [Colletotrichum kahawae]|uniref:Short-chain dehydrogenase reductase family n=1 Tax=Colletotrichum kahawae TaxID=34407 RepID=A0AAD9YCP8_COLKA|nr:short-chain dehydrogenase reductase family [Colletotrichum kahawae]
MPSVIEFLQSQLLTEVPVPTKKFAGQTIIVTGSNTGLGLEAARHFVLLDAAKVILAVRSILKGKAALAHLEESTGAKGVVEVWELDLTSYASVQKFAKLAQNIGRLDVLVNNAGVMTYDFVLAEKDDSLITVNAVSPLLLSMLLLPKLRETSLKYAKETVITFVGSLGHARVEFIESKTENIFKDLAIEKTARMAERYNISKVIQLQLARELAENLTKSEKPGNILVSVVNPGLSDTEVARNLGWIQGKIVKVVLSLVGRAPEEASRTLVLAAEGGPETHGQYLDDGKMGRPSDFITSDEGIMVQKQLWKELLEKLDAIVSGIADSL